MCPREKTPKKGNYFEQKDNFSLGKCHFFRNKPIMKLVNEIKVPA